MTDKRTAGQVLIGCWCDEKFVSRIDSARRGMNRSQFARDALVDKLVKLGVKITDLQTWAPDRTGKGGRPKGSGAKGRPKKK
jgi:hypothetical protein